MFFAERVFCATPRRRVPAQRRRGRGGDKRGTLENGAIMGPRIFFIVPARTPDTARASAIFNRVHRDIRHFFAASSAAPLLPRAYFQSVFAVRINIITLDCERSRDKSSFPTLVESTESRSMGLSEVSLKRRFRITFARDYERGPGERFVATKGSFIEIPQNRSLS